MGRTQVTSENKYFEQFRIETLTSKKEQFFYRRITYWSKINHLNEEYCIPSNRSSIVTFDFFRFLLLTEKTSYTRFCKS